MSELELALAYQRKQGVIGRERRRKAKSQLQGQNLSFMDIFRKMKKINEDLGPSGDSKKLRTFSFRSSIKWMTILDTVAEFYQVSGRSEVLRDALKELLHKTADMIGLTPEERQELWR